MWFLLLVPTLLFNTNLPKFYVASEYLRDITGNVNLRLMIDYSIFILTRY